MGKPVNVQPYIVVRLNVFAPLPLSMKTHQEVKKNAVLIGRQYCAKCCSVQALTFSKDFSPYLSQIPAWIH